jgi:hypothetical protein
MSMLMRNMAQRASRDRSLMASLIARYSENKNLQWDGIAAQLWIDNAKLAKLALCRRPTKSNFSAEIAQIVDYVGVDREKLLDFIRTAESIPVAQATQTRKAVPKGRTIPTRRLIWAFAGAMLFFIVIASAFMFLKPEPVQATLVVSMGQASVSRVERLALLEPKPQIRVVSAGQAFAVKAGDTISIERNSVGQLRLKDGSTVDLNGDSKINISDLNISKDTYQVRLMLMTGNAVSRVMKLLDVGDYYEIISPSSTVSVRGTVFTVQVITSETTYVACEKGVVNVQTGEFSADINAGEQAYVNKNQPVEVQAIGGEESLPPPEPAPEIPPTPGPTPTPIIPPAPVGAASTPGSDSVGTSGTSDGIITGATDASDATGGSSETEGSGGAEGVPGKPPDDNPGSPPTGGGQPPGQSKKDQP